MNTLGKPKTSKFALIISEDELALSYSVKSLLRYLITYE